MLNDALDDFPVWPEAIINRAVAKIHTSDFEGAISDLRHAEELLFVPGEEVHLPGQNSALLHGKLLMFLAEAMVGRNQEGDNELARVALIRAEIQLRASGSPEASPWLKQFGQRLSGTIDKAGRSPVPPVRSPVSFVIGVITGLLVLISIGNIVHQGDVSEDHPKTSESTRELKRGTNVVSTPKDLIPDKTIPTVESDPALPVSSVRMLNGQSTPGANGNFSDGVGVDRLFGEPLTAELPEP